MRSAIIIIVMVCAVQLVKQSTSAAYQLEPISRVFSPSGAKATQSFELVNSGDRRIAVMISFAALERSERYVETNRDAEDEFLAYPPQMILAPGTRQTVRVSWLGTPNPARELTYRIIVTQVPLEQLDHSVRKDDQPQGQMRVMLNYRGTLFIRPAKAAPRIVLRDAELEIAADGTRGLAITLDNAGTAVGLVKTCALRLASTAGGPAIELSSAALAELRNTRVLAGGRRRYIVPWPAVLAPGRVNVTGQCSVEP
jgi:fimbrial chaperone protein